MAAPHPPEFRRRAVELARERTKPGDGHLHYGTAAGGDVFPAEALGGQGVIADIAVRCEAPEWAVHWHTEYPPQAVDRHDVPLLCKRFGLELPGCYR